MHDRPYVLLSCSMSLDGYLDSATDERLMLSNDADFDRVDEVRAGCDAIMVGAATVRNDNPALQVRSELRRSRRVADGLPPSPMKVTLTAGGDLDPCGRFFTRGDREKLVYCPTSTAASTGARLEPVATVVDIGPRVQMRDLSEDLYDRGVRRLMVEGGGTVHTQFLTEALADELHLVVAPFFVGDSRARRFVGDGLFPWHADHRATLVETRPIGDVVLLRYALSDRFQS
jgi:5-amino-6-(5-phosphoribosylamino)uracil reductase